MAEIGEGAPTTMEKMEPTDEEKTPSSANGTSEEEDGTDEELYEVEKIIGMSKASGKTLYKVRWRGYGPSDDTWEPVENLQSCLDMIEEYETKKEEAKLQRAEERKRKKAIMEGRVMSDSDNSRDSTTTEPTTTLKDTFWKDLEEGRLNLFATDMYSRVKGGGRSCAPKSKAELEDEENCRNKKRRSNKGSSQNLRERDKSKKKKIKFRKHSSSQSSGTKKIPLISESESDSSASDIENISTDSHPVGNHSDKNSRQSSVESCCQGEQVSLSLHVKNLDKGNSEKRHHINDDKNHRRQKSRKMSSKHGSSSSSSLSSLKDKSNTEKLGTKALSPKVDLSKLDMYTSVKIKSSSSSSLTLSSSSRVEHESPSSASSNIKNTVKVDAVKTENIFDSKPSSPIKSYLSGGSTPPRKFSVDSPNHQPQALASSTPADVKSKSEKRVDSKDSYSCSGLGQKRKLSSSDLNSAKSAKQRRDSDFSDSGLGSSVSSVTSQDSIESKNKGLSRQRRDSMEFSQPLDDIWNGSFLPLLPESTKSEGRGADLSFDIELDDIDLDQLDQQKIDDDDEATVDISDEQFRQAVMEGDYSLVRKALNSKKKYDAEAVDDLGITLLMYSAQNGYDDIAEILVNNKANINAQQTNGTTSLMLACEHAQICTVALLVELGANVNLQQTTGETALMKAVRRGHKQIVKFLLEHGANFSAQNNSGFTAVTYAKMMRLTEIEDIIVDYISRLTAEFDKQVSITLNNTAKITSALFPLQCFPLSEGEKFVVNFKHELQANTPGVGYLLFVAHARITAQDIRCRFYGPCAVETVTLNGVRQPPLTEEANFVLSCCPLQHGRNEIIINTVPAPGSKAKLVVCAYKAQLIDG